MSPYIHWDFPYALYRRGGWLNRDSADWFADYTTLMVNHLGDRVKDWMTINEPAAFVPAGHEQGRHAPGDRLTVLILLPVTSANLTAPINKMVFLSMAISIGLFWIITNGPMAIADALALSM